jgi:hypothetical protein
MKMDLRRAGLAGERLGRRGFSGARRPGENENFTRVIHRVAISHEAASFRN